MNEWVEVISGLNINDTIVTKGFQGLAKAKKIKTVVFDRGGYIYTGRIASLADGARKAGLDF